MRLHGVDICCSGEPHTLSAYKTNKQSPTARRSTHQSPYTKHTHALDLECPRERATRARRSLCVRRRGGAEKVMRVGVRACVHRERQLHPERKARMHTQIRGRTHLEHRLWLLHTHTLCTYGTYSIHVTAVCACTKPQQSKAHAHTNATANYICECDCDNALWRSPRAHCAAPDADRRATPSSSSSSPSTYTNTLGAYISIDIAPIFPAFTIAQRMVNGISNGKKCTKHTQSHSHYAHTHTHKVHYVHQHKRHVTPTTHPHHTHPLLMALCRRRFWSGGSGIVCTRHTQLPLLLLPLLFGRLAANPPPLSSADGLLCLALP